MFAFSKTGEAANRRHSRRLVLTVALTLAIAACAQAKPFVYTAGDEIPNGPGLFSGDDGEFKVYRR